MTDQCLYEQLSEDWRNRDRITWQLPAVLVVVAGLLLSQVFWKNGVEQQVENWLLWGGFGFTLLFTIILARNLYLQAVGADLIRIIQTGGDDIEEAREGALRIPLRRTKYGRSQMLKDFVKPISSVLLLMLCAFIVGLFLYLLIDDCVCGFVGGILSAFFCTGCILCYSYKKYKVKGKVSGQHQTS